MLTAVCLQIQTHNKLPNHKSVLRACRKVFEPFGGLKSAFTAARDGKSADTQIEMARGEGLFTSNPDYIAPLVGDIELVFIAFDILFVDEEVTRQAVVTSARMAPCRTVPILNLLLIKR